ncbi:GNAT family N-acetyltransferase [Danxiaibacter flavus]|uniref:GNAT family N-acetyltransferase n=1 Tax=Danxiaibacter flavus TaxID=3049108 RepID=A0ABV3ZI88_9BACT|nr:GNAT family N-acetyltransferase [Chitinophagaceae bacterium DXS]
MKYICLVKTQFNSKTTSLITIKRTDSTDSDFIQLVCELDKDLAIRDGVDHSFYDQFNKIDMIKHAIVGYEENTPVACGAIKEYAAETMEVKRMYVLPEKRGKGFASDVLNALEEWAKELGYRKCILETGKKQPEAIQLYTKNNYAIIPNYGQYEGIENSVCFEKVI